jgi:oxalate decarboxylase/phosphoglucose isomerase-like protein (cupin superfamily)
MELVKRFDRESLVYSYDVDAISLLPWEGVNVPFEGAYCIARPHSKSLEHINFPLGEQELFICISGEANVVIGDDRFVAKKGDVFVVPPNTMHHVENTSDEPFHYYAIWWNRQGALKFLGSRGDPELPLETNKNGND